MGIKNCKSPEEINSTFDVMLQLRPTLRRKEYLKKILDLIKSEGYQLFAGYVDDDCKVVAGLRYKRTLF